MKTAFGDCPVAKPLQDRLWFNRGDPAFWKILQSCDPRVRLHPPATDAQIRQLVKFVGGELPPTLEDFLRYSNGLTFDLDSIVFPAEATIEQTQSMRTFESTLPIDHLLFIGSFGDGDMFAFAKNKRGEWLSDVFWWEHETDSCYDCGLGIFGYVSNHVGWCHAVGDQPAEDPTQRNLEEYKNRLRQLSGEEEVLAGLRGLVGRILDLRAREDFEEATQIDLFREFLNQLTFEDFRKVPIEHLLIG